MSVILPINGIAVNQDYDFAGADAALRLIESLPVDFRARLIRIAADRCRRNGHQLPPHLPDTDTLRRALDRPRPPEGWVAASGAIARIDARSTRRRPVRPSPSLWDWYDREIDTFFAYREKLAEWRAVAVWHPLARETVEFMREVTPDENSPAHPTARGVRLMARPDSDLREEASRMAAAHRSIQEAMVTIPGWAPTPDQRRQADARHWRRVMRRETHVARQYWQAALGMAHAAGAPYCSDYTLMRWRERQQSAAAWAADCDVVSPDGDIVALSTVKDAAARGQIARLYVNTLCLQELGRRRGLVPVFVTLTLPPHFHPRPQSREFADRTWTPGSGPMVAMTTLQGMWARFRARLAATGVPLLGLRVVEPHQDGTPHLHAMVWVAEDQVEVVAKAAKGVAPGERQADIKAMIAVGSGEPVGDRKAASPASYLMKYLLKTTNATTEQMEAFGVEMETDADREAFDRVRAQMSELGVRRFALLGLHGVQRIWQKIATAGRTELTSMPETAQAARRLMDEARQGRSEAQAAIAAVTVDATDTAYDGMAPGDADGEEADFAREASAQSATLWTDALLAIGAVRDADAAASRLRGLYEDKLNAYGATYRRWQGFYDTATGEYWIAPTWSIQRRKNDDRCRRIDNLTVADRYPRGAAGTDPYPVGSGPPRPPPDYGGTTGTSLADITAWNASGRAAETSHRTTPDGLARLPF